MVFSSIIFLCFFLPIVLAVYHLLFLPITLGSQRKQWYRLANCFLFLSSLLFYFWGEQFLVWIVLASTLIDYGCGLLISGGGPRKNPPQLIPNTPRTRRQKIALIASIVSNLAFLGVFKYFNFGIDTLAALLESFGLAHSPFDQVIRITLPLGISFYTFQSMSYTIDVYRGQVRATRNFIDFACYVVMFPQLVAGPIVRYIHIHNQLLHRTLSVAQFASGVRRFIIGLGKKVLIANTVSGLAENVFRQAPEQLTPAVAWVAAAAFAIQIYFDFSGYSDMAIGLGRMLGFEFNENFNYPYIARSVKDFWRRWHISLSTWFRDYLYIPLGGSRTAPWRTWLNLGIVFFLCGLWHGASWNFVVWGLYHGAFLILERTAFQKLLRRLHPLLQHAYLIVVVLCGWVFFASETIAGAFAYLGVMFGLAEPSAQAQSLSWYLTSDVKAALILGILFSAPVAAFAETLLPASDDRPFRQALREGLRTAVMGSIFLLCLMNLSSGTHNPFIYFRF